MLNQNRIFSKIIPQESKRNKDIIKQKLRERDKSSLLLNKILKGVLQTKENGHKRKVGDAGSN